MPDGLPTPSAGTARLWTVVPSRNHSGWAWSATVDGETRRGETARRETAHALAQQAYAELIDESRRRTVRPA